MNPDVFMPVPVPADLSPFFRRAMVACCDDEMDFDVIIRGTGYCYLGWVPSGRWRGIVNGKGEYDSDICGTLHLSGQVYDAQIVCRFSGKLHQIFCEFTALGQYEFLGIPGRATFEKAIDPSTELSWIGEVKRRLDQEGIPESREALANVFFSELKCIVPAARAPNYLHALIGELEETHGNKKFSDLVKDKGVSERKARNDFIQMVGLSPKRFSKLLQINAAFGALMSLEGSRLAELAAECGFSDQAHMTRSFVAFLGSSPVRFVNDIEPTLKRFVGYSRNFDTY